jgi:hypothetical protein
MQFELPALHLPAQFVSQTTSQQMTYRRKRVG